MGSVDSSFSFEFNIITWGEPRGRGIKDRTRQWTTFVVVYSSVAHTKLLLCSYPHLAGVTRAPHLVGGSPRGTLLQGVVIVFTTIYGTNNLEL